MIHNLTFIYLSSRGLDGIDINNNIEVDNHQTGPEDEGANVATIVLAVLLALVLLVGLAVLIFVKRGLAFVSIHLLWLLIGVDEPYYLDLYPCNLSGKGVDGSSTEEKATPGLEQRQENIQLRGRLYSASQIEQSKWKYQLSS